MWLATDQVVHRVGLIWHLSHIGLCPTLNTRGINPTACLTWSNPSIWARFVTFTALNRIRGREGGAAKRLHTGMEQQYAAQGNRTLPVICSQPMRPGGNVLHGASENVGGRARVVVEDNIVPCFPKVPENRGGAELPHRRPGGDRGRNAPHGEVIGDGAAKPAPDLSCFIYLFQV